MKNFYIFILSILLFNCSSDYKLKNENLKNIKIYQPLVFANSSNWEVKFDSLNTIQKFFSEQHKQIDLYEKNHSVNYDKKLDFFATGVFPYVQLDNLKISFAQPRNNTSSIYYGLESTCLLLPYNQKYNTPDNYYYNATKTFFDTLKPKTTIIWNPLTHDSSSTYIGFIGPYININISGDSINELESVLKEVVWGYLDGLEDRSQKLFKKDINKLEESEIETLMENHKLELKLSMAN